ncbi:MAG: molybdenum ABC transporter ATP-binding protein [Desulfotignum sp.]|nr:molybdenum ABC transporter ATP-binding protein [Desulfotignum sp.]
MVDVCVQKQQGGFFLDVAFAAEQAGVTALFGHSGAGKTSVVNMVAGLSRPDRGRIIIGDRCCYDGEKGIHLPPEKRRIGYVFQEARLFPHLNVRANLTFGMKRLKPADRIVECDQVVALLGIASLLKRRPARLSGGEKQRVAIGRALLCSPNLLLMDEPLASLDQARKEELLPFIRTLSARFKIPVLYVSHQMDEIEYVADRLVFLENGRVTGHTSMCPG